MSRLVRSPLLHQLPSERRRAHELPNLGRLVWHPRITGVLDQLMAAWRPRAEWTLSGGVPPVLDLPDEPDRSRYVFHHLNAARHDAGTPGLPWHHDYDQYPQTNRSHLMVHVLIYLNGLNGTVGDLLLAPGTQRSVASKRALWHLGWQRLPDAVVIDRLPPGGAVLMNSAMFHARIPRPGGEAEPRYFLDGSYCQGGIRWPGGYGGSHRLLRERHLAEGGDRPWLFDETLFFDPTAAHGIAENARGSLLADAGHTIG
ncbi:phytanoyl-CoA dioxygenase [Streptacidiphilus sp. PB12-B1b]|uniref:phytanoyl-CoA dioxygenase n=1 Tax=Streptacidiphilus sp. PB12-B1b TaxID=2705012 RepID=UPI0015FA23E3|nr:phytanoyl-CoA dioxygenase [Streptacidiphilus sp. PB12-B1b]QMU78272.1 phytanoyl-CoA dioxygenase [Streptacidiphilus sp. PB12-B1b]